MSLICDPRAPINVNAASLNALSPDRDLQKLIAIRNKLMFDMRKNHESINDARDITLFKEYEHIKSQISSNKAQRRRKLIKFQKKAYFRDVGTQKIERQFNGNIHDLEIDYVKSTVHHEIPKRRRLMDLCDFKVDLSKDDIAQRRIETIANMIALCRQSESRSRKKKIISVTRSLRNSEISEDPFPLKCRPI